MIGRFFRKLFGGRRPPAVPAGYPLVPAGPPAEAEPASASDIAAPPGALPADEVEDRFYRLILGAAPSTEAGLSVAEQLVLRRLRDAFGGERFDVGSLPRLPSVVPQLMRSLRNDEVDSRTLAEQIGRDTVLVGEVIRVANSAYFRTARPVTSLPQAITLLGQDGLRRVVMQLVMRPILRTDTSGAQRQAGDRLWEHAERCARACHVLGRDGCDPFEAFLAGLVSHTGAQAILHELEHDATGASPLPWQEAGALAADPATTPHRRGAAVGSLSYSRPFVAAVARQIERLSLHAARHWHFPSRVIQALAERADPADAGARTPLGRALLAASRVAMVDVLIEQGHAGMDAVLLASPGQRVSQTQLVQCQDALRAPATAEA